MLSNIICDCGGHHLCVSAKKQWVLKNQPEFGQAVADRGLPNIQSLGRPGDAFFLIKRSEDHQAIEVELRKALGIER
ncbi:hypothetical protein PFUM301597_14560 [Pseudomonas fluorescens]